MTSIQSAEPQFHSVRFPKAPNWMKWTLLLAGIYNVLWGALVIVSPSSIFEWTGAELPHYLELWQCIGMIVGVYGIGYWIAAYNPARHWPIILVGFLGKFLGPIGIANAIWSEVFPLSFVWTTITNDLIWLVPFGLILRWAYIANNSEPPTG